MDGEKKTEIVTLSKEEMELLNEYQKGITSLEEQRKGALQLIIKQRALQGTWTWDGAQLIRQ